MRYCIFCGVEIPGDARYCQVCGKEQPKDTQVEVDAAQEEAAAEAKEQPTGLAALLQSPQKMILAGAGAFLAALLLCTLLMLLFLK